MSLCAIDRKPRKPLLFPFLADVTFPSLPLDLFPVLHNVVLRLTMLKHIGKGKPAHYTIFCHDSFSI